jgi:phage terminase large subunit-like protein
MGMLARMMNQPLMPHQQHMADVTLEIDPATGLLAYREYVIIVGRQNGKTVWVRSKLAHRALSFGEPQRTAYTTQTADKAREKWRFDQVERYQDSPLAEMIADVTLRLNSERLTWTNGSVHSPVTPSQKTGGTGDSLDEPIIDEAWVHEDSSLESAMRPTMSTRLQPQLGVLSTAKRQPKGQHSPSFAAYLRGKQRAGRARVEAGLDSDIAFFDYSAAPDSDPADPDTWWGCLPALGHSMPEKAIAADFTAMERADFCAEYLGMWEDESAALWQVFSEHEWRALADRDLKVGYPIAFGLDVTPERGMAAIGSAGPAANGQRLCVEVVEHAKGTEWVVPRMVELCERWRPCAVVINPASASNSLVKPLRHALASAGLADVVRLPTIREVAEAYGQFFDAVTDSKRLCHSMQAELDAAAAVATKRRVGPGAWCWDWASHGDVSPLISVTGAAWGSTVFGPAHVASDYDILKSVY